MRLATALILLSTLGASPSFADWQYTKWGMTKEEVIAASQGKAEPAALASPGVKPGPCQDGSTGIIESGAAGAKALYETGRFRFSVCFYFDKAGKLSAVEMALDKGQLQEMSRPLYDSLFQKYGKPEKEDMNKVLHVTDWRSGEDRITFWSAALAGNTLGTLVLYRPLATSETEGL